MGSYALNGDHNWQLVGNAGLQLSFDVVFGPYAQTGSFSGIDHDHKCMALAISTGTCSGVIISNGATCYSTGYLAPESDTSENDMSGLDDGSTPPAIDPFKSQ
jgi:hypothetical protein